MPNDTAVKAQKTRLTKDRYLGLRISSEADAKLCRLTDSNHGKSLVARGILYKALGIKK